MKHEAKTDTWSRLLLILLCLLPLVVLFLLPGGGFLQGGLWFWVVLLICWLLIWSILGTPKEAVEAIEEEHELRMLPESDQPQAVRNVMNVRMATAERGVQVFRGRLRESADAAFEKLKRTIMPDRVPLLQEDPKLGASILLLPKPVDWRSRR